MSVVLACKLLPGCLILSLGDYTSQNAMYSASFLIDHAWRKWFLVVELCILGHVQMWRSYHLICPWQGWWECG